MIEFSKQLMGSLGLLGGLWRRPRSAKGTLADWNVINWITNFLNILNQLIYLIRMFNLIFQQCLKDGLLELT